MATSEKIIRHQKLWLLAMVAIIILMSVIATLWVRGIFLSTGEDIQSYQNVTMTDAVIACENEIRTNYNNRLRHLTLDNLSSRYDKAVNLYRVFFSADLQVGKDIRAQSKPYLASCLVDAKRGKIKGVELFEKKENAAESTQKRDGGIFGWP